MSRARRRRACAFVGGVCLLLTGCEVIFLESFFGFLSLACRDRQGVLTRLSAIQVGLACSTAVVFSDPALRWLSIYREDSTHEGTIVTTGDSWTRTPEDTGETRLDSTTTVDVSITGVPPGEDRELIITGKHYCLRFECDHRVQAAVRAAWGGQEEDVPIDGTPYRFRVDTENVVVTVDTSAFPEPGDTDLSAQVGLRIQSSPVNCRTHEICRESGFARCARNRCSMGAEGDACDHDRECDADGGFVCENEQCTFAGEDAACTEFWDCAAGHDCVEEQCEVSDDAPVPPLIQLLQTF